MTFLWFLFPQSYFICKVKKKQHKEKQQIGATLSHVNPKHSLVNYCYCLKIQRNLLVLETLIMQIAVTQADLSFLWLYGFAASCFALVKIINQFSLAYKVLTQAFSLDVKSVDLTINFIQVVGIVAQDWIWQSVSSYGIFQEKMFFLFQLLSISVVSSGISYC